MGFGNSKLHYVIFIFFHTKKTIGIGVLKIIRLKDRQNRSRVQLYIKITPSESRPRKATQGVHFRKTVCMRVEIC